MTNYEEEMDRVVIREDEAPEEKDGAPKSPSQGHRIISLLTVPAFMLSILSLPITLFAGHPWFGGSYLPFVINIIVTVSVFCLILLHGKSNEPNFFSLLLLSFSVAVYIFLLASLMGF